MSGLRKEYPAPGGGALIILDGVDVHLGPGESLAVLGPSGSGKSTLLNIIGTLDRPTSGLVRIDGENPFALDEKSLAMFRASRIGFVFQDHHLLPQCTALENVLLARLAAGRVREEDVARARGLLEEMGLGGRAEHFPHELSGGERQRVAVARALMNRPRLLLCDEPTGNLDQRTGRALGEMLAALARDGRTALIVVTHSMALAAMFARRARLEDGRLVEEPVDAGR